MSLFLVIEKKTITPLFFHPAPALHIMPPPPPPPSSSSLAPRLPLPGVAAPRPRHRTLVRATPPPPHNFARSFDGDDDLDAGLGAELAALIDPDRVQRQAAHLELVLNVSKVREMGGPCACGARQRALRLLRPARAACRRARSRVRVGARHGTR